jgi:plastocyanin
MRPTRIAGIAAIAVAAVSVVSVAQAGDGPTARAAATTVNVSGKEFSFTLSRSSARHGSITFRFTNKGRIGHDFKISSKQTRVLKKGRSQSIKVSLRKGSYRYLCTVKGHASSGMKGTFRVT